MSFKFFSCSCFSLLLLVSSLACKEIAAKQKSNLLVLLPDNGAVETTMIKVPEINKNIQSTISNWNEFKELFDDRHTDQFMTSYVQDCIFETDMEVRIPDDYVNNVAERLSLYQALDNLKNKMELLFLLLLYSYFGLFETDLFNDILLS